MPALKRRPPKEKHGEAKMATSCPGRDKFRSPLREAVGVAKG